MIPVAFFLVGALLLLGIELKFYTHMVSGLLGTVLLAWGLLLLSQQPNTISPEAAVAVSFAFGIITVFLGFLGMRARKAKLLTGVQMLVGEMAVSQTSLDPDGTVLLRGEYWQAHSDATISPGQQVRVERVQNLLLYVRAA